MVSKKWWQSRTIWISIVLLLIGLGTAALQWLQAHAGQPWTPEAWIGLGTGLLGVLLAWLRAGTWQPLDGSPGAAKAQEVEARAARGARILGDTTGYRQPPGGA